ncbi:hypothetical protein LOTGIDRAFT_171663 [Lottia gigantea]|uniref:Uncharacterized protein n=1 Tax=Lottia gigantea TaxID=225164 RepID=V4B6N7_LOTGI|nr:hypothetical protein LOTGIDRAFT_171663 [Lottia gigantea]ESP03186.1 hypothetical protein LOTGIDRAFT_171663 [Lottia gigantea]
MKKKNLYGVPYIPSYMDLTNGPEPCVVCGDAATGYHYRCMTCEGCKVYKPVLQTHTKDYFFLEPYLNFAISYYEKGFFRRTIQKELKYHCKWNQNCEIDKTTRNQCQECRFQKCVRVGMATDLVLNEKQRKAKRKLIEDNRERKRDEVVRQRTSPEPNDYEVLNDNDKKMIDDITNAYNNSSIKSHPSRFMMPQFDSKYPNQSAEIAAWQQLAEAMTPSIVKVVEFAKGVPGFTQLNVDDQILLLKSCCMEIMCLRAARRYEPDEQILVLSNGMTIHKSQLNHVSVGALVEPIFEFAIGLAKLSLDETEVSLLAAVLLMQSDRTGLKDSESVEKLQDAILGAFKRYITCKRPHQPVHWAKVLMKVTDLRTISTRHAERVLCARIDSPAGIPPLFMEMFKENTSS